MFFFSRMKLSRHLSVTINSIQQNIFVVPSQFFWQIVSKNLVQNVNWSIEFFEIVWNSLLRIVFVTSSIFIFIVIVIEMWKRHKNWNGLLILRLNVFHCKITLIKNELGRCADRIGCPAKETWTARNEGILFFILLRTLCALSFYLWVLLFVSMSVSMFRCECVVPTKWDINDMKWKHVTRQRMPLCYFA